MASRYDGENTRTAAGSPPTAYETVDPEAIRGWLGAPAAGEGVTNAERLGVQGRSFSPDRPEFPGQVKGLVEAADVAGMFRLPPEHRVQVVTQNVRDRDMREYASYTIQVSTPEGQSRSGTLAAGLAYGFRHGEDAATSLLASAGFEAQRLSAQLHGGAVQVRHPGADRLARRADELLSSGGYPNRARALQATHREAADQLGRRFEEDVLGGAARLDAADNSPRARLIRQTAASIRGHRAAEALRQQWPRPEAATGQRPPAPASGHPARLAAASLAAPASGATAGAGAAAGGAGGASSGRSAAQVTAAQVAAAAARATGSKSHGRSR